MQKLIIQSTKKLEGALSVPSSKSHSIRAILFAALAKGKSRLEKLLLSDDIKCALKAAEMMGAKITYYSEGPVEIEGTNGIFNAPSEPIDAQNSGQVLRFFGALSALADQEVHLTGDHSLKTNRPIKDLTRSLTQLGAKARSIESNDFAPFSVKGPAKAGEVTLNGQDSQPVSALIMLAVFLDGTTRIHVKNPGEKPWVDLTLSWLDWMNVPYKREGYTYYEIEGKNTIEAFQYTVVGDLSSAAFPAAAAFATKSKLTLKNIDLSDVQGDKKFFSALDQMGAQIEYFEDKKEMIIDGAHPLNGVELDINDYIDAICILAVVGCLAEGQTILKNAEIARQKESDRIESMAKELKKMNAEIEEKKDGLIIKKSTLKDATVDSHKDHRIALSLSIAALAAEGSTVIHNTECIQKSYPSFVKDMQALGAQIEVQ